MRNHIKLSLKLLSQHSGYSLVQVLIALSLGTIVTLGLGNILVQAQKDFYRKSAQVSRFTIVNNIRFNAASFVSLNKSALENRTTGRNPYLAACACGELLCQKDNTYSLDVLDNAGVKLAGGGMPQYYNHNGDVCDPSSANCIFQATASFRCIGENCGTGLSDPSDPVLRISYSIKPIDAEKSLLLYGQLPEINSPEIDITAHSIKSYALQNNLCVTVTSFYPKSGSSLGGTSMTFAGSGLSQISSVMIGNSDCAITSKTNSEIKCTTGAGTLGINNIQLNYGTFEKVDLPNSYTYDSTPVVKTCLWHPLSPAESPSLPPCRDLNNGERYPTGGGEYECRCE